MKEEAAISVKNINKHFKIHKDQKNTLRQLFASFLNQGKVKDFTALEDISFEVFKGEFFGIVGRNGSGKSTLLKIISGIYAPDKGGSVKVKGKLVPFLELGVGFNMELTGRENVYLNGVILGMTREYIKKVFNNIVEFAELEEFIDEPVKNYSSGMLVRLAFSIAIQSDADIYVLDEILAVGDISFQRKCLRIFNDLKKQGKTVLYVSHSMESIEQFCDRAVLIEDHKVLKIGKPDEVTAIYQKLLAPKEEVTTDAETSDNRWGTKEVEITNIEVSSNGEIKNSFNSQENINIKIDYYVNSDIESFAIGIAFYKEDGTLLFGTNSLNRGEKLELKKGEKKSMDFQISASFFPSDSYDITIAAYNMATMTPLDYLHQMHSITVNNDSKDIGVVILPSEYKHS